MTRARRLLLSVVALMALAAAVPAGAQMDYVKMSGAGRDIRVTQLAPNIVQFTVLRDSYVRQLNATAIITNNDVILFDSLTRPSSAAIVLDKLKAITKKPVRLVINSHAHPDHWSGTEVFAKAFPGLDVIASEPTDRFMHLMAPVWAKRIAGQVDDKRKAVADEESTGKLSDGSKATPDQIALDRRDLADLQSLADEMAHLTRIYPTIVYHDQLRLTHGGEELELTAVYGDQEGTTQVYLPREKVLLTGDLVSFPMPFVNSRPSRQLEALKSIDAMDWRLLVPGHGPAMSDHSFVKLEIALIEAAIAGVHREIAAGDGDVASVQSKVTIDELRESFAHGDQDLETRYAARVKDLVKFVFQEMTQSG